jgi:hypothetical protein
MTTVIPIPKAMIPSTLPSSSSTSSSSSLLINKSPPPHATSPYTTINPVITQVDPAFVDPQITPTYIARLVYRLKESLRQLGVPVDIDYDHLIDERSIVITAPNGSSSSNSHTSQSTQTNTLNIQLCLEQMAFLIHECMSIGARNYHGVAHVFVVAQPFTDPIAVLAALFHDTVYYHVDGGLSEKQRTILAVPDNAMPLPTKAIPIPPPLYIASGLKDEDPILCLVEEVFGFTPGTEVTLKNGLNEFLSAVLAARQLAPILEEAQQSHRPGAPANFYAAIMEIVACIEATIPFRGLGWKEGMPSILEQLFSRVSLVNERFCSSSLNEDALVKCIQRAVEVTNSDVENFGSQDRTWFLDNTWSLLPETNESLRHQYLYTVHEFQFAVFKMNGFFNFLPARVVFHTFRGVPSEEVYTKLTAEATRNLEIGKKYVGAKLLSMSVLSAFAELSGGDAPISLFMGDLPSRHRQSIQLSDQIPAHDPQNIPQPVDCEVYDLLAVGRRSEMSFDIKQSPVAAYLYGWLGDEKLASILKSVPLHPMTPDTARKLLQSIPLNAILLLGKIMANVALSRKHQIEELLEELGNSAAETK